MPQKTVIGQSLFGLARFGDGRFTFRLATSKACQITYSIGASKYQSSLALSYTIERKGVVPLFLFYRIAAATVFSINGQTGFIRPDHIIYTPHPVVGYTLLGAPLLQGYQSMSWSYVALRMNEYATLLAFYNAQQPEVLVTYPDENGTWQQRNLVMYPPSFGSQQQTMLYGVTFTFLIPS